MARPKKDFDIDLAPDISKALPPLPAYGELSELELVACMKMLACRLAEVFNQRPKPLGKVEVNAWAGYKRFLTLYFEHVNTKPYRSLTYRYVVPGLDDEILSKQKEADSAAMQERIDRHFQSTPRSTHSNPKLNDKAIFRRGKVKNPICDGGDPINVIHLGAAEERDWHATWAIMMILASCIRSIREQYLPDSTAGEEYVANLMHQTLNEVREELGFKEIPLGQYDHPGYSNASKECVSALATMVVYFRIRYELGSRRLLPALRLCSLPGCSTPAWVEVPKINKNHPAIPKYCRSCNLEKNEEDDIFKKLSPVDQDRRQRSAKRNKD